MHVLSKLLAFAFQPLVWVAVLLALACVLLLVRPEGRGLRWGRRLVVVAMGLLLSIGWQAPPNALLAQLEDRFAPPEGSLDGYVGMVVLGGALGGYDGRKHDQTALGCAGERVVVPVPLMAEYPHMKLLFAGGTGQLFSGDGPEADVAARYFARMGVDMRRVMLERHSRNTWENAVQAAALPGVDPGGNWLLVTSAWHMPRALAAFRKAGWQVTPYPVDWMSSRDAPILGYDLAGGAWAWEVWLREVMGLVVYRLTGRA